MEQKCATCYCNFGNPIFAKSEIEVDPKKEVYLPCEEQALVRQCWKEYSETGRTTYLIYPLAFLTGLRVGEASCIMESDIDFEQHTLTLQRSEGRGSEIDENGRIHAKGYIIKPELKKHHKKRVLPLTEEAERICKEVLRNNRRSFRSGSWLFVNKNGDRQKSKRIEEILEVLCNHAGIPHKSFHKLRKTYASRLIASNAFSRTEVQVLMGHTDITTTLRYYSHDTEKPSDKIARMTTALSI